MSPAAMEKSDVDVLASEGLDDGEILEANQIIGYFNYVNRCINARRTTMAILSNITQKTDCGCKPCRRIIEMDMNYAKAKELDPEAIPVVDTGRRDGSDLTVVARALDAASKNLGFIYIEGHGIPADIIAAAQDRYRIFRRSAAEKKPCAYVQASRLDRLRRQDVRHKADLKESFVWGYQDGAGNTPDDHPLRTQPVAGFRSRHGTPCNGILSPGTRCGPSPDARICHRSRPGREFLRTTDHPLSRASYVIIPLTPEAGAGTSVSVRTLIPGCWQCCARTQSAACRFRSQATGCMRHQSRER